MKNIQVKLSDTNIQAQNSALTNYIMTQNEFIPTGVNMANAPVYWTKGVTGNGIKIAIIDSGCNPHPDLNNNILGGRNFTTEGKSDDFSDKNGHGSHVAGTIAANGRIYGMAPNAKLLILKGLDKSGNGNMESIINAINYAVAQNVDIISLSLGCVSDIPQLHTAIKNAMNKNIMIVCASGNNGDGIDKTTIETDYPAGYEETISVASIDDTRKIASFSNSNRFVDLVTHGTNVISVGLNNDYVEMSGTSMSTPHVAGALALLKEKFIKEFERQPSYMELYALLVKNTIDLNIQKISQGHGMLFLK